MEFPVQTRYHAPALPWSVLMTPLLEISAVMIQGCLKSRREGLHLWGKVSSPLAQEDGLGCCACPGGGEMGWEKSGGRAGMVELPW